MQVWPIILLVALADLSGHVQAAEESEAKLLLHPSLTGSSPFLTSTLARKAKKTNFKALKEALLQSTKDYFCVALNSCNLFFR